MYGIIIEQEKTMQKDRMRLEKEHEGMPRKMVNISNRMFPPPPNSNKESNIQYEEDPLKLIIYSIVNGYYTCDFWG